MSTNLEPQEQSLATVRHDGWMGERQRIFIETLADSGIVAQAAAAAGLSPQSAYALRRRAEGHGFACAWDAALLLARRKLVDCAMQRAIEGQVEPIYYHGQQVGERVRHDNRLLLALLARLDKRTGMVDYSGVAIAAAEFDEFLDRVAADADRDAAALQDMEVAELDSVFAFLDARCDDMPTAAQARGTVVERRLRYRKFGSSDPEAIPTDDLAGAAHDDWTDEQWDRADWSGYLANHPSP